MGRFEPDADLVFASVEAIAQLRAGQVRILVTVDLFNEGVDIPEVDGVLFLRLTEIPTVFLQQLGRGLRLHPGKTHLQVIDMLAESSPRGTRVT